MSQGSKKKRWPSLQIVSRQKGLQKIALIGALFSVVSCGQVQIKPVHSTSGDQAKTLRYLKTIDVVGLGFNDAIKRIIAGRDEHDLNRPVAIDVRDDVMIIADSGRIFDKSSITVAEPGYGISDVGLRIVDNAAGVIFLYNMKTGRMKLLWGAGDHIKGDVTDIYLASDKSFYLTDVEGRRALHFSPDGKLLKIYKHPPNIFRPIAITVDEKRKEVLIADETYSHIVAFDMQKAEPIYGMGDRGNGPGKFRIITDMIAIPDGFLVSDRIELRVQVLDREGNFVAEFGRGEVTFPTALAVDAAGRVFVSDKADSTIKVFKAGKLIDTIGRNGYGNGEFRYISDMKVAGNNLYVVDSLNGRIQVFEFLPEKAATQTVIENQSVAMNINELQ
ncbi:MAG: 6-bladed beta-propeller [Gammaproteobacteria bacterium]|nr:6-bladed beta-propeller [Gammaproteobacteria bacterium]